jgi:hypothetical protein
MLPNHLLIIFLNDLVNILNTLDWDWPKYQETAEQGSLYSYIFNDFPMMVMRQDQRKKYENG